MKKGWQTKKLAEVCDVKHGFAFDGEEFSSDVPAGNPLVITPGNFTEDGKLLFNERNTKRFSGTPPAAFRFNIGDLVVVMTDLSSKMKILGKPAFIETDDVLHNQRIGRVKFFNDGIDKRFVYYFMMCERYLQSIKTSATGTMVKHTAPGRILGNEILLPPLAEQQRIVGLLDEAFEALATAKANAEKNLQNARAIFESHLQSVFSQRGEGWVEKSLGETCEMYQPKTIGTKDLVLDGPYPVFGANGVIGRYDKFNHEEPQLLVTCRGATCGSVNISEPNSWITGNAMVVRPKDHALHLHFLEFVFRGGIDISTSITGAAQPQITRTNLSPLLIRYPKSVTEQTRLAEKFEDLTEETQRLARIYERKLAALEALKKSLLHQAFNGEI